MWTANNVTKLENEKNGQLSKNKTNLLVSKPENHNLRRETEIEIKI